eukprot:scaffold6336_cov112-Isochrysis_galbana.AAC.3
MVVSVPGCIVDAGVIAPESFSRGDVITPRVGWGRGGRHLIGWRSGTAGAKKSLKIEENEKRGRGIDREDFISDII